MDQCQFVFDIESYKRQSRMKELIVNPLRECCKKILEKMQDSNGEHTKRKYFHRHHASTNQRLIDDYFSNQPTYDEALFWVNILLVKPVFLACGNTIWSYGDEATREVKYPNYGFVTK
jgi:hypothetical protein